MYWDSILLIVVQTKIRFNLNASIFKKKSLSDHIYKIMSPLFSRNRASEPRAPQSDGLCQKHLYLVLILGTRIHQKLKNNIKNQSDRRWYVCVGLRSSRNHFYQISYYSYNNAEHSYEFHVLHIENLFECIEVWHLAPEPLPA
jgi:hypothetical protein